MTFNSALADTAARIRTRNLGEVLNGKRLPPATGGLTPWQRSTLSACRAAGLTALSGTTGTVRVSHLKEAPAGGHTEEWRVLVTPRDLTNHLADPYGT